jgi:DNA-binding CsgD family transcriptional regulator
VRTVERLVSSLLAKLGARNRTDLAAATWNCSDAKDGDSVAVDA